MRHDFLSYFTPSLMSAKTLEDIFVQREELAQEIVDVIAESASTPSKHYSLLIGPRGIGKTHLISLIYHRICRHDDLRDHLRIAWLREEEWGVSSFLDLLLRVLAALQAEAKDAALAEKIEAFYSLPAAEAEHAAAAALKDYVGKRSLLILAENLDDLFEGMGEAGQKRLRSFIQENPFWIVVATAQSLFPGVSRRTSPFYGFFTFHFLEDLSLDDATALLTKIADLENKQELSSFIQAPMGRARIRAVHHLAGGNPRVYVIFSQFLTREALDELVDPFMHMLDELTPYYQAKMKWLSSQQRKIVDFLCDHRGAVPVKEIAKRCFITQQTASSQLQDLRTKGYVVSEAVGRESYYELREPLMRMCIDVKKSRGGLIKLFVDFLRLWYSYDELKQCLASLRLNAPVEREYMLQAIRITQEDTEDPRVVACWKDMNEHIERGQYEAALKATEELIAIRGGVADRLARNNCLQKLGRFDEALAISNEILILTSKDAEVWEARGRSLIYLYRYKEALASFDEAANLDPTRATAWEGQSLALFRLERYKAALSAMRKALRLDRKNRTFWFGQGQILTNLRLYNRALKSFNKSCDLDPNFSDALVQKGLVLNRLGRYEEASASLESATCLEPNDPNAWYYWGESLMLSGNSEDALPLFKIAIELGGRTICRSFGFADALIALGRWNEAIVEVDEALMLISKNERDAEDAHYAAHTCVIMRHMAEYALDKEQITAQICSMFDVYKKSDMVFTLAHGLLINIPDTASLTINREIQHAWLSQWETLASNRPEFELPLRLLGAAISYSEANDLRVLLDLPSEERDMLRQMLNLDENGH